MNCKYLAFYNGKQKEIEAPTLYAAKVEAVKQFKAPKSREHMVSVHLVEKDGKAVTHIAVD
jgi:hypothetical protein